MTRRCGFALLMTLVLILLAGVALTAVARTSLTAAVRSQEQVQSLQRKWAVRSCQVTLLGRAEDILDEAERGSGTDGQPAKAYRNDPMRRLAIRCALAGQRYDLVLTDEQAKLNVNHLLTDAGRAEAQSALQRTVAAAHGPFNAKSRIRLRPLVAAGRGTRKIGSYGQVFQAARPDELLGDRLQSGLASTVTCWGSGQVNLRRAPEAVVRRACEKRLGPQTVRAILTARKADPYADLHRILQRAELDAKHTKQAEALLTDASGCHGLWVVAHGRGRNWHSLVIGVGEPQRGPRPADAPPRALQRYTFGW